MNAGPALVLLLATGCARFDIDEVIELVPDHSWSADDVDALTRAAVCWNLGFGTRFEVVAEPGVPQVVFVAYNPFACWNTLAVFSPGEPAQLDVCPFGDIGVGSIGPPVPFPHDTVLFGTLLHELGHAAGIRSEGSNPVSVMDENTNALDDVRLVPIGMQSGPQVFSSEDRQMLEDAAGPHHGPCDDVELVLDTADGTVRSCRCPHPVPASSASIR